MKAIILAAGRGERLGIYTKNLPKCMLVFAGKTLLQRQVDLMQLSGVNDITVVKGYLGEMVRAEGVKHVVNENYAATDIVATLMLAEKEMDDDILVSYGDIVFERRILDAALRDQSFIGVAVDQDWRPYWNLRFGNDRHDTESLVIGSDGRIEKLGEDNPLPEKAQARYIGLIRFSAEGIRVLKEIFQEDPDAFKKIHMTGMLQKIIDAGFRVDPIVVRRGWIEFDTVDDYEKITKLYEAGDLGEIFRA